MSNNQRKVLDFKQIALEDQVERARRDSKLLAGFYDIFKKLLPNPDTDIYQNGLKQLFNIDISKISEYELDPEKLFRDFTREVDLNMYLDFDDTHENFRNYLRHLAYEFVNWFKFKYLELGSASLDIGSFNTLLLDLD
jgi:hypothetical protein